MGRVLKMQEKAVLCVFHRVSVRVLYIVNGREGSDWKEI